MYPYDRSACHQPTNRKHLGYGVPILLPAISIISCTWKSFCADNIFPVTKKIQTNIACFLQSKTADFYDTGLLNSVPQYEMCCNYSVSYVEKMLKNSCICFKNFFSGNYVLFLFATPRNLYLLDVPPNKSRRSKKKMPLRCKNEENF